MELKEILKNEERWLKRCRRMLGNVKILYMPNLEKTVSIDLTDPKFKDIEKRLNLRYKISETNKLINKSLVERLQKAGYDVNEYLKTYWNKIIEGFASLDENFDKWVFYKKFLVDRESKLYRRFPDSITAETMELYLKYLRNYALNIKMYGNKVAIERAKLAVESDDFFIKYADSVLPKNWSDICKQIRQLKERERLNENKNGNEERE